MLPNLMIELYTISDAVCAIHWIWIQTWLVTIHSGEPVTFVRADVCHLIRFWSVLHLNESNLNQKKGWFKKESKYTRDLCRAEFDPSEPQRDV